MRAGSTTHFVLQLLPGGVYRFIGPFDDHDVAAWWATMHIGDVALWRIYLRSVAERLGMIEAEAVKPEEAA